MRTFRRVSSRIVILLLISACGQVQPQQYAGLAYLPDMSAQPNRPSVSIQTKYLYDLDDGQGEPKEDAARLHGFRKLLEKVTRESTLFGEVMLDYDKQPTPADFNINMEYRGSVRLKDFWSTPFGQWLGGPLAPLNLTQKCKITARITDRAQKDIASYVVEDHIEVSAGPFAGQRMYLERKTFEFVLENMIRTIYRKMLSDRVLVYP